MNLGDIAVGQILYFHFTTRQFSTGAPITSANLAISVYKDDSTTQSTAGVTVTFTSGFDNVAGLVSMKIDTSQDGTFYAAGHDFSVVVTTGTADSVSIVGEVVGYFSIANRSALRPTVAGRTINIDSTGLSDSNMVKVGPTGTGTAQTARDIGASVLVGDKTGFSLVSGYDPAKTAAQAGDAMTLTAAYDAAKTALQSGGNVVATNMRGTDSALLAANYTAPDNADVVLIKAKTDSLTFTVAGQVDANIQRINDTTITGDGQPGTEFGV